MQILIVTGIFPPDHGGPASYVPAMANALARIGHRIIAVVTLTEVIQHDAGCGFPVVRIVRNQNRLLRRARTIWCLYRLAADADVVFVNGLVLESVLACKVLRRRRVVVKAVGDLVWEHATNAGATQSNIDAFQTAALPLKWRALRWLQRLYMKRADRVLTPSRYLAGIVRGWGVPEPRIRTIYNASDLKSLPPVTEGQVDLVTVARLVPWKGIDALIRLAADAGWSLDIVGDGPMRQTLETQICQLGERGRGIRLLGALPKSQVAAAIRRGGVFVLNSSYEGLPHIVLEATAAGVPVIATKVGGTPEALLDGQTGLLVPVGDAQALRTALAGLLANPAHRRRLVEAGQRRLQVQNFERMVEETAAALGEDAALQAVR